MPLNLFWFRRDLRLNDNRGLFEALKTQKTLCCFIWDCNALKVMNSDNPRIDFIAKSLDELKKILNGYQSDLIIKYGKPQEVILELVQDYKITSVIVNEEYEPETIKRDDQIRDVLKQMGVDFHLYQDHVISAKSQILTKNNTPYTVYTPYKKAWLEALIKNTNVLNPYPSEQLLDNLYKLKPSISLDITQYGFVANSVLAGGAQNAQLRLEDFVNKIDDYASKRDFPALDETSHLGADLRFGTISIRALVSFAYSLPSNGARVWLSELIWREFFSQILYNFPHVVSQAFRREYNNLNYNNNQEWFDRWCNGMTGFPIVDAGMRQLNSTGFMHNRVRMICASFLTKDLLIDWRRGEQYFADKLLDYDLASNNGNWQWCASTGCDAQPYFRIFNPVLQSERFDPTGAYIRRFVPELELLTEKEIHFPATAKTLFQGLTQEYPKPIVIHQKQSVIAKEMFQKSGQSQQNKEV